jgi:hypothetical protein
MKYLAFGFAFMFLTVAFAPAALLLYTDDRSTDACGFGATECALAGECLAAASGPRTSKRVYLLESPEAPSQPC